MDKGLGCQGVGTGDRRGWVCVCAGGGGEGGGAMDDSLEDSRAAGQRRSSIRDVSHVC